MKSKSKQNLQFRIPKELHAQIKRMAEAEKRPISKQCEKLLEDALASTNQKPGGGVP